MDNLVVLHTTDRDAHEVLMPTENMAVLIEEFKMGTDPVLQVSYDNLNAINYFARIHVVRIEVRDWEERSGTGKSSAPPEKSRKRAP